MSKIRVDLTSVQSLKGQGIGEGNLELNIKVQEGNHKVFWPDPYPAFRVVDQGGAIYGIDDTTVATYEVASGTLSKKYTIEVKEIDKGTLGQDDVGFGDLTFDLTPTMAPSTKYATIELKRPNMNKLGKVKVGITAQRV
jgi:hypothetical protein